jgi:hypothetical protein
MRILCFWGVLVLVCSCSASRRWSSTLMNLEQQHCRAIEQRDSVTLSKIYADDFVGVAEGNEYDKKMLLKFLQDSTYNLQLVNNDQHIRFIDNRTAIMTGRLTSKDKNNKMVGGARYAHVFVYRHGKWQIAYAHGTIIPLVEENDSFTTYK